jgi:O-antigen/teichoic acid export membrane protein
VKLLIQGTPENNGAIDAVARAVRPGQLAQLCSRARRHASGGFGGNVVLMLAGTALGQAASVLLSPALTRIYTPDQFGYLGVYAAVLTILGVVAALGFDQAIPLARSIDELANLLASCAIALAGTTIAVSLAAWLLPDSFLAVLWLSPLASYRTLVPIGFACVGGYYVMVAAATRLSAFRDIAWTRISQGLSGPIAQIVLGLSGAGAPGLAIGFIVGQSSGTAMIFSRVLMAEPRFGTSVSWRGIRGVMLRYVRFPLFASWARVLDMAGGGSVLFLVFSACYSTEIAGYMFLTERVIARPLLIVSTSLLQVFTGEAGQAVLQDPAKLRQRFWQVLPRQFVLAAGWIALANLAAGWAFPILFGQQWDASIPYLRALSVSYLALAVLHPVSTLPQVMERQVMSAAWQVGRLILVIASAIVAWQAGWSALTALWLSALAQGIACAAMLGLIAVAVQRLKQ